MSNVSFDGFDELMQTLEDLGQVGNKISNKALKEGSKVMLDEQKKETSSWSDNSDKLTTGKIKKYKSGNAYISVGINEKNWEDCRGMWFQNFNGSKSNGQHIGWINDVYERAKDKASDVMLKEMASEVDKILK